MECFVAFAPRNDIGGNCRTYVRVRGDSPHIVIVIETRAYLIGGAYWMPPALQSWFSPRGIPSFDPEPKLRSYSSP